MTASAFKFLVSLSLLTLVACGDLIRDPELERIRAETRALEKISKENKAKMEKEIADLALGQTEAFENSPETKTSIGSAIGIKSVSTVGYGRIHLYTGKSVGDLKNDQRISMLIVPGLTQDGSVSNFIKDSTSLIEYNEQLQPEPQYRSREYLYTQGCDKNFAQKLAQKRNLKLTESFNEKIKPDQINTYLLCGAIDAQQDDQKLSRLTANEIILKDCELTSQIGLSLVSNKLTLMGNNVLTSVSAFSYARGISTTVLEEMTFTRDATLGFYSKGGVW